MKKGIQTLALAIVLAVTVTSCKKDTIAPTASAISQMDNKTMKMESIRVGEIEIAQYIISNFAYNASLPTLFEPKITNGGTSLLYKTADSWQIETAKMIETKNGMLNVQFNDSNPNGIGYQNQIQVPQELLNNHIITYQQNNGGYNQPYYICSSEVMNGNYNVEKVGERFILTRTEEPVIVMTMTIK